MSTSPMATIDTVLPMATAGNSGLETLLPMLQMAKGSYGMLDAARRGRILQGLDSAASTYSGYQSLNKPSGSSSPTPIPSTQSKFGMSQDEFMALDPQLRERMLKQLMGR